MRLSSYTNCTNCITCAMRGMFGFLFLRSKSPGDHFIFAFCYDRKDKTEHLMSTLGISFRTIEDLPLSFIIIVASLRTKEVRLNPCLSRMLIAEHSTTAASLVCVSFQESVRLIYGCNYLPVAKVVLMFISSSSMSLRALFRHNLTNSADQYSCVDMLCLR